MSPALTRAQRAWGKHPTAAHAHSAIAGMILSDLILEHANAWTSLYDPGRLPQK